jgi:hypothetical protein
MALTKQEFEILLNIVNAATRMAAEKPEGVAPDDLINLGVMKQKVGAEIAEYQRLENELAEARAEQRADESKAQSGPAEKKRSRAVKQGAPTKRTTARKAPAKKTAKRR